ncbi:MULTISPECIES: hypothetical protein [unclassified Mesorhizobium]|uniref:hypothetical protein n=1 Tax=unclassified Mesorhizobium TaxID=325217 RepID=UPI000FD4F2DE|nr:MULTISPECIES: hypothetical protein [unclassified Mesorhizobium]RUV85350.1 hypothetical protein EOA88_16085 [Mesorhizobium sp. M5C.F.Ca.IN.020.14.1.1]RUV27864.1 hypothetical protein EOA86_22180 [Mesorhizobium sp. M5C.F.Ca.IN.020.32.2.1]RWD44829.1 MAG: hypothetical protein EOS59_22785 [Mesorhizobium sp.]RWE55114.1 MAG: hypothetical protein EOS24_23430 [Mesorhizobium sp.]RWF08276.1 MAG: hypothetical protein EOS69_24320 [Mesorhizobium sp.]
MPLQNRVDPFGVLRAVPERGRLMGNRGIIHDPETKTLLKKRWALQAWIICLCEFRDVRREPMGRNRNGGKTGWTELFFLDEVTALSAGHRPCFFCRRERAGDFVQRFGVAYGIAEPRAPQVDKRLHKERLAAGGRAPVVFAEELAGLPDGAMIAEGGNAYAMRGRKALRWSFAGYGDPVGFGGFAVRPIRLLTPATTISVLRQGYEPVWHPSAET